MNGKLLWSIALPGFGQLLNGALIKGILLVVLEFIVNVKANFNEIIMLSFNGNIEGAIQQADYGWLMFYPCLYFFAAWDAYRDDVGEEKPYMFLPFAFSAFFVTVGLMFSKSVKIMGVLLGPVWFPMSCVIPGVAVGFLLRYLLMKKEGKNV